LTYQRSCAFFRAPISKGFTDEAHLPTPQYAACSHAWLPRADVHERWPQGHQQPSAQGSCPFGRDNLQEVIPLIPTNGTSPPRQSTQKATQEALPRSRRLLKRRDFLRVQEGGVRITTRHLLILLTPRVDGTETRLGLVASRKMGGAVQRNRAKRLVRESFRRNSSLFPACVDLVMIVRSGIDLLSQSEVEAEIVSVASLLRKRASGKMPAARPAKPRQ